MREKQPGGLKFVLDGRRIAFSVRIRKRQGVFGLLPDSPHRFFELELMIHQIQHPGLISCSPFVCQQGFHARNGLVAAKSNPSGVIGIKQEAKYTVPVFTFYKAEFYLRRPERTDAWALDPVLPR